MISDLPANRSIPSFSSEPAKTVDSGLCHQIAQNRQISHNRRIQLYRQIGRHHQIGLCHQIGQNSQNSRFPPYASSATIAPLELGTSSWHVDNCLLTNPAQIR